MSTLGADPEAGLYNSYADEGFISAVGLVEGTKDEPFDFGDGTFMHRDNVLVEAGWEPASDPSLFVAYSRAAYRNIEAYVSEQEDNTMLWIGDAMEYRSSQLDCEEARNFGCEPDYDAYTGGKMRKSPGKKITDSMWRSAGGHIHLGGDFNCPPFVVALFADIGIGLKGVAQNQLMSPSSYGRSTRVSHYGKAGIFREKPYGIEYRTPNNEWWGNDDKSHALARNAFRLMGFLERTSATQLREIVQRIPWMQVRETIEQYPIDDSRATTAANLLDQIRALGVEL
jgi:hypothetical protein